jgi:hypothetical protein
VNDYDDDPNELIYSIVSISNNGFLEVVIDTENYLDIIPLANFDGSSEVVLKATDDDSHYGLTSFFINMIPSDDPPIVEFTYPTQNSVIMGKTLILGTAVDIEGKDVSVQFKIGENIASNTWMDLDNSEGHWEYLFDTREYTERTKTMLIARGFDGLLYSEDVAIDIIIDNTLKDGDGDGYSDGIDQFPEDPKEWIDSDDDGVGDNEDPFDRDPTQWSDQDGDGFGDNNKGKGYDMFPLDPTQHKDKDGDGYGDNQLGNNPDLFPDDPTIHNEATDDDSQGFFASIQSSAGPLLPVCICVVILIVVDIYVISYLYMARSGKLAKRRQEKERLEKQRADEAKSAEKMKQQEAEDADDADKEQKPTTDKSSAQPIIIYRSPGAPGTPGSGVPPMPGLFPVSASTPKQNMTKKKTKKTPKTKDDFVKTQDHGMYGTPGPTSPTGSPQFFPLLPGYQPPGPGTGFRLLNIS